MGRRFICGVSDDSEYCGLVADRRIVEPERHPDIPFGEPELMMSFTKETPAYEEALKKRDERFALDSKRKQELRKDFDEPKIHPDADQWDQSKLPRK